jgi:hypothetical protein
VKTNSARLWSLLLLGFLTTDFITLVCCRVDPRLLASNLLLALCLHLESLSEVDLVVDVW